MIIITLGKQRAIGYENPYCLVDSSGRDYQGQVGYHNWRGLTVISIQMITVRPLMSWAFLFILRYSFDYGSVHFVMMSTEHDYRKGSRQYTWLEKDLKSVDRNKTPWLVLGGHRPMYSSQKVLSNYLICYRLPVQASFLPTCVR